MNTETNPSRTASQKKKNKVLRVIFVLQLLVSLLLAFALKKLNVLPLRYYLAVVLILAAALLITLLFLAVRSGKGFGIFLSALFTVFLMAGSYYVLKTSHMLDFITNSSRTSTTTISIVVPADSPYTTVSDLSGSSLGIQETLDQDAQAVVLSDLYEQISSSFDTVSYGSYLSAAEGLYGQQVNAMLLNESFRSLIEETYPDFSTDTRVLTNYLYETEQSDSQTDPFTPSEITQEPFTIYLSGNDSYGEVTTDNGRSDVNILMTVNPQTKMILLTTTPRDYYVELGGIGAYDKLTHAGLYGIDCSKSTLENLYGVDIDYYVRVNFSGFSGIVDALGGVSVYSDYDFMSTSGYYFTQGYNDVDGDAALAFVRERYAFSDGDFQRGRNQMHMIEAIFEKMTSPSILVNYVPFLDSVSDCFVTDISSENISALVQMQLSDNADWTIVSNEVNGYAAYRSDCYSAYGQELSVVEPDYDSVAAAAEKIKAVENGEVFSE